MIVACRSHALVVGQAIPREQLLNNEAQTHPHLERYRLFWNASRPQARYSANNDEDDKHHLPSEQ